MRLNPERSELAINGVHELTDVDLDAVNGGVLSAAMAGAIAELRRALVPATTGCYRPYRATLLTSSAACFSKHTQRSAARSSQN
jgi:hypothetical protein